MGLGLCNKLRHILRLRIRGGDANPINAGGEAGQIEIAILAGYSRTVCIRIASEIMNGCARDGLARFRIEHTSGDQSLRGLGEGKARKQEAKQDNSKRP